MTKKVELTQQDISDLTVGLIHYLSSTKKGTYEEYYYDNDGLMYKNNTSEKEWNKNHKSYIKRIEQRIQQLRNKLK
jgi:hypothetical protein